MAFSASILLLKANNTELCIFLALFSGLESQTGLVMGFNPLKACNSSYRRSIPPSILNIEVGIMWATTLDQVVSLIALINAKKGF
jgi:hypothetical protein